MITTNTIESLKYPIGRYQAPADIDKTLRQMWIEKISSLPAELGAAVSGLNDQQLNTPYREGGWTVRQVVHHVADSHMNSYIRFRWAMTEDKPVIKAYEEGLWAELPDARTLPVIVSLDLLGAMHRRWTTLLESMTEGDYARCLIHPASGEHTLGKMLGLYAWHGQHHTAHVLRLRERMGWGD